MITEANANVIIEIDGGVGVRNASEIRRSWCSML